MELTYDPATCAKLAESFRSAGLLRPMRIGRYEPGEVLAYDVTGVAPAARARVTIRIEKFVGGGFAGQVYRVTVLEIEAPERPVAGLTVGGVYAMKILTPPSSGARRFRDALYMLGFQASFQLQTNPLAARAGALWQKLIRRAAGIRFGTEQSVVDIFATFVDPRLGSSGELSEWVDGRVWRFEVDDDVTALRKWCRGKPVDPARLGSPEYRAKRRFMAELTALLHELGAPELARQYEWWTCKSQPNCLKRRDAEGDPEAGLTAVDFRAGLALLPVLPMSPADIPLILKGAARGSLVQFDRGDLRKLEAFIERRSADFEDLRGVWEELKRIEPLREESVPDVAHHHVRLLWSRRLWRRILDAAVTSWEVRGAADERCAAALRRSRLLTLLFLLAGWIPLLSAAGAAGVLAAVWATGAFSGPRFAWSVAGGGAGWLAGRLIRGLWGRADLRAHYGRLFSSGEYFGRAVRAKAAEQLVGWLRAGRVSDERALQLSRRPARLLLHLPLSLLPATVHRILTDGAFARAKLDYLLVRPVRLYFNAAAREQWLREMLEEGQRHNMLSDEDAQLIRGQLKEPFIQKYLKSLAVHVCTLPVTQLVALAVAIYGIVAFDMGWAKAWAFALGVFIFFQAIPISPGSLVRGLYVVYVVLRERNIRDYNIAVCLGFFKYVGYLAFPIQMTYRYPALARFMAGHWATGFVHAIPVFGERGALLEHAVFGLFYNYPLTVRRRMAERAIQRRALPRRRWHAVAAAVAGGALLAAVQWAAGEAAGTPAALREIWPAAVAVPLLAGALVTWGAGGLPLSRRVVLATISGIALGVLGGLASALAGEDGLSLGLFLTASVWPAFLFAIETTLGALATEILLPESRNRSAEQTGSPLGRGGRRLPGASIGSKEAEAGIEVTAAED